MIDRRNPGSYTAQTDRVLPLRPLPPLASFVYLALATLTSLSKGASKGIAPFSPALLSSFGTEPEARSR